MPLSQVLWMMLVIATVGIAEPTPQPSVEPPSQTPQSVLTSTTASSDLKEESQDQVAILKQINRVNDDGSYTFGYEAADGSFKIETRDVAGNVKGMFGFVDDGGELKRISYTASNGTGYQTTGSPNIPPLVAPESEQTTRISLLPGATTENPGAPIYIYKVTTRAPRPEVIEHIPKLRPTPGSLSTPPTESEEITDASLRRPAYGTVLPKKSPTPNYITLTSTTEEPEQGVTVTRRPSYVQTVRPRGYKKVLVTKRPVELSTIAPVTTTQFYTSTYASPASQEMMETGDDIGRQVESNSLADTGLLTSGTEDSPDVFGVNPTARPYPADAYQTLFSPLPQYQRILQDQSQILAGGSRLPPTQSSTDSGAARDQDPRITSPDNAGRQDQTSQPQSLVPGRRLPVDPLSQDPRLSVQNDGQDPRIPSLAGLQDPRLANDAQRLRNFPDPRLSGDPRLAGILESTLAGRNPNSGFGDPRNEGQNDPRTALGGYLDPRLVGLNGGYQDPKLNVGVDPRYSGYAGQDPRIALGGYQDPRLNGRPPRPQDYAVQDPRIPVGGYQDPRLNRGPQNPSYPEYAAQDPRIPLGGYQDPRLNGDLPLRNPGYAGQDPRITLGGNQDPRLPRPNGGENPGLYGPNIRLPVGHLDPRLRELAYDDSRRGDPRIQENGLPIPGAQGQTLPLPREGGTTPRNYQGLASPSGQGRERILPPPGAPGPLDYSQNANARSLPSGNLGEVRLQRPIGRRQQLLPPYSYNPLQGLTRDEPGDPRTPYGPERSYLMEQLLRMLLSNQARQQSQAPYPQFPPDLLRNPNYDPMYQRYGPYQPYPQSNYGPPQAPYDPRYFHPYPDPRQTPYPVLNPYQGYDPYSGVSNNPYYQLRPEEALFRMLLESRYPRPIPENEPQIQNSPLGYDNPAPPYSPRQPTFNDYEQSVPGSIFGQRVPPEGAIVQRSPLSPTREVHNRSFNPRGESSQRSTTIAPKEEGTPRPRQSFVQRVPPSQRIRAKGSRNVQIIDDTLASGSESTTTTAKP